MKGSSFLSAEDMGRAREALRNNRANLAGGRELQVALLGVLDAHGYIPVGRAELEGLAPGLAVDQIRWIVERDRDKDPLLNNAILAVRNALKQARHTLTPKLGTRGRKPPGPPGWYLATADGRLLLESWACGDGVRAEEFDRATVINLADLLGVCACDELRQLGEAVRRQLPGLGYFYPIWFDPSAAGHIGRDAIIMTPSWDPEKINPEGVPTTASLAKWPPDLVAAVTPHIPFVRAFQEKEKSFPKLWLREYDCAHDDDEILRFDVGATDFYQTKALERAMEHPTTYKGVTYARGLREAYEKGALVFDKELYGILVAHVVVFTADHCILVLQRSARVDFEPLHYSPSFEEHFDPRKDRHPNDVVMRGLDREWNIGPNEVNQERIALVAFGREYGKVWHTPLIYVAHLKITGREALDRRRAGGRDRKEARAAGYVPVFRPSQFELAFETIFTRHFDCEAWIRQGAQFQDVAESHPLHSSTGAVRLLFALWQRYGSYEDFYARAVRFAQSRRKGGVMS